MALANSAEYHRRLIQGYFGPNARIRILRDAPVFDSPVFVVDFDQGARHYRTLGSVGGFAGADQVTEQSSMDMMYPAHLVFHYERLMSLAFALVERPVTALLLGVGGAAMWRFVRAYLPDCAPTLVDCDEAVVAVAKRWFYLTQPAVIDDARRFLATTTQKFDAILVDLYDAHGPAASDVAFWTRCLDALAPGGCLATNWADFATNRNVKPIAQSQQEVARARGLDCTFVTRRGFRDNLIQYLPTGPMRGTDAILPAHERFARDRRLPNRGRGILEDCLITGEFPLELS
jgi:predicted O-methyltransferase YrrM